MPVYIYRKCKFCNELQSVEKHLEFFNCKVCSKQTSTVLPGHNTHGSSAALIDPYTLGRKKADPLFREFLGAVGCKNLN